MSSYKRCVICKKPGDLIELYEGIYDDELVMVCEACATEEKIPLLKKPSLDKLQQADKRYSVRERMEKMSGMDRRRTELSREQTTIQDTINRLRPPEPKQKHEDVVENYYWVLNMARRRKKMTLNQVAIKTDVPLEILEAVERGKLPKGFEQYFVRLEDYFGIRLLRRHRARINFVMPKVDEESVLNDVKKKMETVVVDEDYEYQELDKKQKIEKLKELEGEDFKIPDDTELDEMSHDDLIDLKREKEEREKKARMRKQTEDLLGDDIDILRE